jgi:hypothetical protein
VEATAQDQRILGYCLFASSQGAEILGAGVAGVHATITVGDLDARLRGKRAEASTHR